MSSAQASVGDDTATRGPLIVYGNIVPVAIASVFCLARFWSRLVILKKFHLEDWLLVVGWLTAIGNSAACAVTVLYGAGKHTMVVPPQDVIPQQQASFASRLLYQTSVSMTKISLCVLYLRVFGMQRTDKAIIWFCNIMLITSLIALLIFNVARCHPLAKAWDIFMKTGHCADDVPSFWTSVAVSILSDVILLLFSAWKVYGLQMRKNQKVIMYLTVGLGWVTVICAIVRAIRINSVIQHGSTDPSWELSDISVWPSIEVAVGLICTSAPAIKPLLRQLLPSFILSFSSRGFTGSGRGNTSNRTRTRATKNGTANGTALDTLRGADEPVVPAKDLEHGIIVKAQEYHVTDDDDESRLM